MLAVTSIAPLRRATMPGLAGMGRRDRVALTYDDGPDPAATPLFLDLLERQGVHATFFLLGRHAAEHQGLVREMAARGHELAVHGWDHRCVLVKSGRELEADLARTVDLLHGISGERPAWYRPPYGVMSVPALRAARAAGLRTVLWSTWGRDWQRSATPERIVRRVERRLVPGGTVLLHDSDRMAAPGSWANTLSASARLLDQWAGRGLAVGPLRDHGL
jgi:peptidoglycan/xylan/chitin deacetylase (PgdA/CDA1 family)